MSILMPWNDPGYNQAFSALKYFLSGLDIFFSNVMCVPGFFGP